MRTGDDVLMDVLEEVGQLATVRREMAKYTAPDVHAGAAGLLWQIAATAPIRMSDLADGVRVDLSAVSRQVGELVAAGQVDRRPDPTDGRACLLSITPAGVHALDAVTGRLLHQIRPRLSGWEPDELKRLALDLRRLRHEVLSGLRTNDEHTPTNQRNVP